jgi:hypothetical protein
LQKSTFAGLPGRSQKKTVVSIAHPRTPLQSLHKLLSKRCAVEYDHVITRFYLEKDNLSIFG